MTESTITPPDVGSQNEEDPETLKKKEVEERQEQLRIAQNLPPGAGPDGSAPAVTPTVPDHGAFLADGDPGPLSAR